MQKLDFGKAELGLKAVDRITGFRGTITGLVAYISGCNQALLTPPVKEDGSLDDARWFDVQRVEVGTETKVTLDNSSTPGAGEPAPIR